MTTAISKEERLGLIRETGFWKVIIRPTVFEERRVPTLPDCWRIVEESTVRLRGWDFPHLDEDERQVSHDYVQSGSCFANQVELWQFYQSGQFVYYGSFEEDREPPPLFGPRGLSSKVQYEPRSLSFVGAVYTLTEIYVFARNLAYRGVLDSAAQIEIELNGTAGRVLAAPTARLLRRQYAASDDTIIWHDDFPATALIGLATDRALDAAVHIFEQFGWRDPPRTVLAEDQRRLLERRL